MKKTPATAKAMTSAVNSADSTDGPTSKATPSTTARKFTGTSNPRELRAIHALLADDISRHDLARVAGVANAPELVARLRRRGLTIPCTLTDFIDRDGCKCRPGIYGFDDDDRRAIYAWMAKRERKEVLL